MTHKIQILALLAAEALGLNSTVNTLDNCATDIECQIAAERHCAVGEEMFCKGEEKDDSKRDSD